MEIKKQQIFQDRAPAMIKHVTHYISQRVSSNPTAPKQITPYQRDARHPFLLQVKKDAVRQFIHPKTSIEQITSHFKGCHKHEKH